MGRVLRNNGLSIVLFALFLLFLGGQSLAGQREYNEEQREHQQEEVTYGKYLTSGHFVEAVFENWESEYLQMWGYVLLTVFLFQKGSAESKDPDQEEVDTTDQPPVRPDAPWPVRRGGPVLALYRHSLTLALLIMFFISFLMHAVGGTWEFNEEAATHGQEPVGILGYIGTSRFWYESLQNWQSEFLAVFSLVVLSIFLRRKNSPESKPVGAPHHHTGTAA